MSRANATGAAEMASDLLSIQKDGYNTSADENVSIGQQLSNARKSLKLGVG